jgi:1,4-dihydroxy-2-naphthoyl-CoA hydrolase
VDDAGSMIPAGFPVESFGGLAAAMGIEIIEASARRVVARMPVEGNTQPYGVLHGGASCVLAETIGSVGSALYAGPDRLAMGIELNASHHRAASEGHVTGVATQLHAGRTLTSYEVVITDDQDRRVCTARLTCVLRDRP